MKKESAVDLDSGRESSAGMLSLVVATRGDMTYLIIQTTL